MAAEKLKSIGKVELGSEKWSEVMRSEAKAVAQNMETGYMDLAKILYQLFDVPVNGDPENGPWFKEWGYDTIGDFAEQELNLQRRKAEYLRAIWYRLEVEMEDMNADVKQRIISLGWSKVRELIKVLTIKNASKWADLAEKCNYPDLCHSIKKYKDKLEAAHVLKAKGEQYVAPIPTKVTKTKDLPTAFDEHKPHLQAVGEGEAQPSGTVGAEPPPGQAPAPEEDLEPVPMKVEDSEKFFHREFWMVADQLDIVDAAMKRAAELSGSDKKGHLLSVICQDFLATNLFGKPDQDQIIRFLAKYEKLLNVRLVIIDEDDDPVYGMTHLENLSAKLGVGA